MTDITPALAAKSDQLNADDLISGPRLIKITAVDINLAAKQKITIHFEGDNQKPWKACKTVGRCLAEIWGRETDLWVGKECVLYRDENVTMSGEMVGGIRVSNAEGLDKPRSIVLNVSKGKKSKFIIYPLIKQDSHTIETDCYLKKIEEQTSSEELKNIWEQVKKLCVDAQDYQALEKLKVAVTEKAAQLKKGIENA
jgi:hypothetical protein